MDCPDKPVFQSAAMRRITSMGLGIFAMAIALIPAEGQNPAGPPAAPSAGRYAEVTVDKSDTSIYIGKVSLMLKPFARSSGAYHSEYVAKVFPFFFFSERGNLAIEFSEEQLKRLDRGETVLFSGRANNSDGEDRRVEGRAIPESSGADHGKIKVRVWVSKRIELIFNTVYRFTGKG